MHQQLILAYPLLRTLRQRFVGGRSVSGLPITGQMILGIDGTAGLTFMELVEMAIAKVRRTC
jgi:hypothetical protein